MKKRILYTAALVALAHNIPVFGTWSNEQLAQAAAKGQKGRYQEQQLIGILAGALLKERTQAQDAQRALAKMTSYTTSAGDALSNHALATYAQLCTKKNSKTQQEIGCLAAELIRVKEQAQATQTIITELHNLKSRLDTAEKTIAQLQQSPLNGLSQWFTIKVGRAGARTHTMNHDVYLNLCIPKE